MPENAVDLEAIFFAARQKAAPDRAAYLDQVCGDDAEVRQRVEQFLSAQAEIGSFLESPAAPGPITTVEEPIREGPGIVIGPYKLLEQIGEGGFGLVFMAEQQQPIRRKVALKILKPGMDTRQVIARFEAERQALALMDHPNIAKVLEGGETASGRPYFVMDLVKGAPITEYCDQNTLSTRERLDLFVSVCQAVQHAHQKGIIHRDIKPTNVLVTLQDGAPLVKVIDFGIAKALGQQLTDKTLFTGFAQMIGTPLYMSPEQAALSNVDVDTRSDIYSLGVLLYELLTGATPFDKERLKEASYDEMRRIIREEEPPRPSTRISTLGQAATTVSAQRKSDPRRLSQLFRGELDWIVMKALEKDRNRRYETASAFAGDVQRYLHDEPVQACPPSTWYRFRKFVRRNRAALTMTSLVLLLLVAGLSVGLVVVNQERRQTQAALAAESRRREQARQALDAMSSEIIDEWLTKQQRLLPEHKKFLGQALASYEEFAADTGQDEVARAGVALAYQRVGQIRERLGQVVEAEAGYRQAQASFEQLATDFPTVSKYRQNLAISGLRLGMLLHLVNRYEEGLAACQQALTIFEHLAADFPAVPEYRRDLAESYHWLAVILFSLNRSEEGLPAVKQALTIQQKLAADFPATAEYRSFLTYIKIYWGRPDDEGLAIVRKLAAEFPNERKYRYTLAAGLFNRAYGLAKTDRNKALAAYQQVLPLNEQLAIDFPSVPRFRLHLGGNHRAVGDILAELGRHEEARSAHQQALRILQQLAADFPDYAEAHGNLGRVLHDLQKYPEAEAAYRESLRLRPDDPEARYALGRVLHDLQKYPEAEAAYREVLRLRPDDPKGHLGLGIVLGKQANWTEAEAECRRALALQPDDPNAHSALGEALNNQGKRTKAEAEYREALRLRPDDAEAHNNLGDALDNQGKHAAAEAQYREAIRLEPTNPDFHYNVGNVLSMQEKVAEAEAEYRKALRLRPDDAEAHVNLGIVLGKQGRDAEAEAEYREALRLRPDLPQVHIGLGKLRRKQGKDAEAEAEYREALRLRPGYPDAHVCLGQLFHNQQKHAQAEAEYREALRLRPDFPSIHYDLGLALYDQGKYAEAAAAYREALRLWPDDPEAHCNLGQALRQQGRFGEALDALKRGHELGSKQPNWRYPTMEWVRQAEQLVALDAKLPKVLEGQAQPADAAERISLAKLCQDYKKLYAAAARFYTQAFAADPKLAADLTSGNLYNAACAAALAGCGQGQDAAKLDDAERARLRRQALDWMRTDLTAWGQLVDKEPDKARAVVQQTLRPWQQDTDFAGMRADALARLPEAERQPWRQLWADVEQLLKKTSPQRHQGH